MERIAMSQEERDELDWLKRAKDGSISQREAAQKMGVSDRWVRTLLKRMSKQGDAVVVHGLRGRPSNRKLPAKTQRQAVKILKQPDWHDFGPTFASRTVGQTARDRSQRRNRAEVDDRSRTVEEQVATTPRGAWLAAAAERVSANWCNGTPPSTTGWKDEGRCATWCG